MTLLAAPPKPSDPTQGPDRPWPGMPPPSFAIGVPPRPSNPTPSDPPKPSQPRPTSVWAMARPDDMPLPRPNPGPPPPPTPKPGIWKRAALAGVLGTAVTVAATLVLANAIRRLNMAVPLNSSEWLIGLVAFIGLVSQFATPSRRRSKQASPSVPSGTVLAVRRAVGVVPPGHLTARVGLAVLPRRPGRPI